MEKPAIAAAKPAPTIDPFHHGSDSPAFELFESMHPDTFLHGIKLPKIGDFQITKFHILLAVAAAIVAASLIWLGRKMKSGDTPRGILWNMLESLLFFGTTLPAPASVSTTVTSMCLFSPRPFSSS
jgi:hypothetical protein